MEIWAAAAVLSAAFAAAALELFLFIGPFAGNGMVLYGDTACGEIEHYTVNGNSMGGLLEDGDEIAASVGYYNCHSVARNDIVLFDYAGNPNPVLKIVRGIEGDSLSLLPAEGGWSILVNGVVLANSQGQPYIIGQQGHEMLSLYISDYNGIIPGNACLLLGNLPGETMDSTRFGLVDISGLIGKVLV